MRITINNQKYSKVECTVGNKEIREVRGVCAGNKCSPSHWDGRVEFKLSNGLELWTLIISSYDQTQVNSFMNTHFTVGSETQCYYNQQNQDLLFQLPSTVALLAVSILFLLLGLFIYFLIVCCMCYKKKPGYANLDGPHDQL